MALSKFLDPKNDVAFRKIFGSEVHRDILIHFINDIMGFEGDTKIKEVTFLSPVQNPDIAYKKESIVDVLCEAQNGTRIIVEMQVSPSKGFEKRAQYYAAKAYSRQLHSGRGEAGIYANLKQIIFIAISDYNMFPEKTNYISHHIILDEETYENDLKDFSFSFVELPKFPFDKIEQLTSIIEKWCYFFKYANETTETDLEKIIGSDSVIKLAYDALNQFNWTEEELIEYEEEIKRIWDNNATEAYFQEKAQEIEEKMREVNDKSRQVDDKSRQVELRAKELEAKEIEAKKAEAKNKIELAKKMLAKNMSLDEIVDFTGLAIDQINALKLVV